MEIEEEFAGLIGSETIDLIANVFDGRVHRGRVAEGGVLSRDGLASMPLSKREDDEFMVGLEGGWREHSRPFFHGLSHLALAGAPSSWRQCCLGDGGSHSFDQLALGRLTHEPLCCLQDDEQSDGVFQTLTKTDACDGGLLDSLLLAARGDG